MTLVELLITFTIIGMLTAMLFPVFAVVQKRAMQTSCLSNMRQIGAAAQAYMADNDGLLPKNPYRWPAAPRPANFEMSAFRPSSGLDKYGVNWSIGHCPLRYKFNDYQWRFELRVNSRRNKIWQESSYQRVRPEPMSVLAYCYQHLNKGLTTTESRQTYTYAGGEREGNYIALRADGSASFVPAGQVTAWVHGMEDGKDVWLPWEQARHQRHIYDTYDVFPDEPWPPHFESKH